ncbi:MAG: glycerate kinase [bacterium]
MSIGDLRARALDIFLATLDAAHPHQLIQDALHLQGTTLEARGLNGNGVEVDLSTLGRVVAVGAGKATAPMAQALEELLQERLEGGVISVKYDHAVPLERVEIREAGHPVPDASGIAATGEILDLLEELGEEDLAFVLISGGGSALLDAYPDGISLEDARETAEVLLECGAPIHEINIVRKHLSRVKGGQLARAARPARVIALVLSDVIGDPLPSIASGPTVPDPSTFADALEVLEEYGALDRVPGPIRRYLEEGSEGEQPETPKPGEEGWERCHTLLVGNNRRAVEAAADRARDLGLTPRVLTLEMEGEAAEVGRDLARLARRTRETGEPAEPPCCLISGGETTVTLSEDHGKGGRNQELALAAALELEESEGIVILSGGTDGTDGPTAAAGAVVDGRSVTRGREEGRDAADHLGRHDAYPFLDAAGDLIRTGPTMTNVMDIVLVLVGPEPEEKQEG